MQEALQAAVMLNNAAISLATKQRYREAVEVMADAIEVTQSIAAKPLQPPSPLPPKLLRASRLVASASGSPMKDSNVTVVEDCVGLVSNVEIQSFAVSPQTYLVQLQEDDFLMSSDEDESGIFLSAVVIYNQGCLLKWQPSMASASERLFRASWSIQRMLESCDLSLALGIMTARNVTNGGVMLRNLEQCLRQAAFPESVLGAPAA